jgi:hypothetical protein
MSRERGAGFFIDGSILRAPDSVTVIVRLYDVAGDSMVRRAGLSGPAGSSEARLGARAVAVLLPALIGAGKAVDVGALGARAPAAIANFLQGERAYRHSRFAEALDHYRAAVAGDSLFALAAMKGAQAASWLERATEERDLTDLALAGVRLLPVKYTFFARGLRSFQIGEADSAVTRFQHALRLAPEWSEAHMALGDVYYHLLPRTTGLDSLAEREFHASHQLDPGFSPPVYHLTEIALRRNDLAAAYARVRPRKAPSGLVSGSTPGVGRCPGSRTGTRRSPRAVTLCGGGLPRDPGIPRERAGLDRCGPVRPAEPACRTRAIRRSA